MARKRVVGMSRRVLAEKTDYDPWRFSDVDVNTFFTRGCGGNPGLSRIRRFGVVKVSWTEKNKLLQATSRSRPHGALWPIDERILRLLQ